MIVFMPLALVSLFLFNRQPIHEVWLTYFFWMFFVGVLAWWVLDRRVAPIWFWVFMIAIAIRLAMAFSLRGLIALLAGLAIYFVGRQQRLTRWLDVPVIQYMGRISYSFYLIHFAVNHLVVGFGF